MSDFSEETAAETAKPNGKPPPAIPPIISGDDFEAQHETEMARLWAEQGVVYTPTPYPPVPKEPRFKLIAFNDVRLDEGVDDIIKGFFPSSGLIVVWGPPKCGKSFWCFDALMHVALGWPYRGHRVTPGPVVYCALEGVRGFKRRIEAFRQAKLSDADECSRPFYLMPGSMSLVADHAQLIADIRKQLGDQRPRAVCIDTLNRSLAGSESSDEDMSAYVRAADAIRDAFNCAVIIIHHCGYSADRPRGHSSLVGALDVQVAVRRDPANDNIVAELELSKDGEVGLRFVSRLKQVTVAVDRDGAAITSCVIEEVGGEAAEAAMAERSAKRTEKAETGKLSKSATSAKAALRALKRAIKEAGESMTSNTIPAEARVVSVDTWRTYAYMGGISPSREVDSKRKAFDRAHAALVNGGDVQAHGDFRWV